MKILAIHSIFDDDQKMSAVDIWRIWRPLRELAKHTNWQIDAQPTFIKGFEKYKNKKDFTEEELEKAAQHLGQYDIVFSSYFPDQTPYTLMKVVKKRYGTQFVLDVDDNMFAVNEDNPFWTKVGHKQVWWMQVMIRDCDWLVTTTDMLADEFRQRRRLPPDNKADDSVVVIPNYVSADYQHPLLNNDPWLVIGYFGGASHFNDLNDSGVMPAIERLMHEHKNIRFKTVGIPAAHYVPVKRHDFVDGKRGLKWITEVFPSLSMDIAIAPILDNVFNHGKSDIKYQEATVAGAVFVGSRIGPYETLHNGVDCLLVDNTQESWYAALKKLVETPKLRQILLENAKKDIRTRMIEYNWTKYKRMFEQVYAAKLAGKQRILLLS